MVSRYRMFLTVPAVGLFVCSPFAALTMERRFAGSWLIYSAAEFTNKARPTDAASVRLQAVTHAASVCRPVLPISDVIGGFIRRGAGVLDKFLWRLLVAGSKGRRNTYFIQSMWSMIYEEEIPIHHPTH